MSNPILNHPASYRDPSGFIFEKEGLLYRQVNQSFKEDFELLMSSGFYQKLAEKNLLLQHERLDKNLTGSPEWYTTLQPQPIAFISYPYEWSFDMLKDAALLTLQLAKEAVAHGLILKDASPYNIQWHKGKLIFIDTLSFEKYNAELPWIAYRQFCECFLSPLLLMHYTGMHLQQLLLSYPEGIPLAITKSLLPWRSRFSFHTYLHIHLHAAYADKKPALISKKTIFSKNKMLRLLASLEMLVSKLKPPEKQTAWSAYYGEAAQRSNYLDQKRIIISQWLKRTNDYTSAADLGANEGVFAQLVAGQNIPVIAADMDPVCINRLYNEIKKSGELNIQPLIIDLSNPSPFTGVNNLERTSFIHRSHPDLLMALALVHHLAIGKNIPFEKIAELFCLTRKWLIVEFVPKEDEKVQLMLSVKKDIYNNYHESGFENAFKKYFTIQIKERVGGTGRILYFMKKNED